MWFSHNPRGVVAKPPAPLSKAPKFNENCVTKCMPQEWQKSWLRWCQELPRMPKLGARAQKTAPKWRSKSHPGRSEKGTKIASWPSGLPRDLKSIQTYTKSALKLYPKLNKKVRKFVKTWSSSLVVSSSFFLQVLVCFC